MLTALLAHRGGIPGLHDLAVLANGDPWSWVGLAAAGWLFHRGSQRRQRRRDPLRARSFWLGWAAVAVALITPLDPMSAELASAHMVQHVLLVLVAAPLFAYAAPVPTLIGGLPRGARRRVARARRRLRPAARRANVLASPGAAWLLHAATLWFWHASVPYDAAVEHTVIHMIEHATFLGTGVLFWTTLLRVRPTAASPGPVSSHGAVSHGYGALMVFTMAMQSVLLAALLTFASTPWYGAYEATTRGWGLEPLADQQLAGAIMWVPAGLIYTVVGVLLVTTWVRDSGRDHAGEWLDEDWPTA